MNASQRVLEERSMKPSQLFTFRMQYERFLCHNIVYEFACDRDEVICFLFLFLFFLSFSFFFFVII